MAHSMTSSSLRCASLRTASTTHASKQVERISLVARPTRTQSLTRVSLPKAGAQRSLRVSANAEPESGTPAPTQPVQPATPTAIATTSAVADKTPVEAFLFPDPEELPDDVPMSIWDHFEELRERILLAAIVCGIAIGACFCFSKDLVVFLEEPVATQGVRFLQLSPGEYFFTTFKVAGYTGLLLAAPTVLYEVIAFVLPGLTKSERQFLGPIVLGSSGLFYAGLFFSYAVLTPAALNFFVSFADGAVESLWSIDQYFEFVLVLMFSTGLAFQVPVIQLLLGQTGIINSTQMFSVWRYVVVGSAAVAAVLTPSTDPFTQTLLAVPLCGLYMGGAGLVRVLEQRKLTAGSGEA